MGGSLGRVDAMVGACEAQKVEGVLHTHLFLSNQIIPQYDNLIQIAEKIKRNIINERCMESLHELLSLCRVSGRKKN